MLKKGRSRVTGTIGDFVDMLVGGQDKGTEQEKVYKALEVMESNGLISSTQATRFKDEYASGDYIVKGATPNNERPTNTETKYPRAGDRRARE